MNHFLKKLGKIIGDQLLHSAFSAATNYRAACKTQSTKAFTFKRSIAFEEINESLFWLEVIDKLKLINETKSVFNLKEADELTRISASSRKTTH